MSTNRTDNASQEKHGPQGTRMFSPTDMSELMSAEHSADYEVKEVQLIGLVEPVAGRTFTLRSSQMTVGRAVSCDIQIDEPSLSSEHARLSPTSEGWRIMNLLSTNGIYVNAKKVFAHDLQHGDIIKLGRVQLRFHQPDAANASSTKVKNHSRKRLITMLILALATAAGLWWILM